MAFAGALVASLIVAFTGSQGGGQLSPVRLTLAGVALAAVLEGLTSGIALLNPDVYDQLRFWQAGSLDIRNLYTLKVVLIPVLIAGATALLLSRALNSLSLGSDTATALGSRVARTQLIGLLAITVLCGSWPDCLYWPDDAAYGALAGRCRSSLVAARHATCHPCPAAVCRYHRAGDCARRVTRFCSQCLYWRTGADLPRAT